MLAEQNGDQALFHHKKKTEMNLVFRKRGGPVLTLDVEWTTRNFVMVRLRLMSGTVLWQNEFLSTMTAFHICEVASNDCLSPEDWHDKDLVSTFGEIVPKDLPLWCVWQCQEVAKAGSMTHAFCGCQRCKANKLKM